MTYTVVWRPTAERKLADIWLAAQDREAVRAAADAMESLLKSTPADVGEARDGKTRILTVSPLAIYFDVLDDDCLVAVWAVWKTKV